MLKATFKLGGDLVEVIFKGNDLLFYDVSSQMVTPLKGLRLSKAGVIKEFPDLKEDIEWKAKALERLKKNIKKLKKEMDKLEYVRKELTKHGYTGLYYQKAGFRPTKFKENK